MDITKLTETELKALGYEQVKLLTATQNNLAMIEQELAKRNQPKENDNGTDTNA
jgi:hypothetical protein